MYTSNKLDLVEYVHCSNVLPSRPGGTRLGGTRLRPVLGSLESAARLADNAEKPARMRMFARLMLSTAIVVASAAAVASPAVKAAAERFAGGVAWQEESVLEGDFSCTGKQQRAILGTADGEIVVAVFTRGLGQAPEVLRFAGHEDAAGAATIRLEDASVARDTIEAFAGKILPGYRPSTTCKGFRITGDASDVAHIYWDHDARRFDSWSQ